ncbi:MAG: alpha-amylase [Flavobacteriales bacterium]|nr:alpha-amylase [Flavobacteriia bacterium]NCP50971.1 alpha-amylase [Flavobacteriales bacterium]PIV92568.1 MAG: alpha-amylase [Flavobacteriaceae bacterium CG17_big_fil_post_rev_8_21_14_2_50_33_15]PIY12670.1 MAG: alpha-amylase [Flavobacteriaceae bacterium CG_4_10_14_3_um_filter_33_47]PJB18070.1 MAG: alpha-amylase [Flavobacteriaceae bacterium CG_4_9_14_3_um_filter_33_16]
MKNKALFSIIRETCKKKGINGKSDQAFIDRFIGNASLLYYLFSQLYSKREDFNAVFTEMIALIIDTYKERDLVFLNRDEEKQNKGTWFLSHELVGMSLYVDRFAGTLNDMPAKIEYLQDLGVSLVHLMPLFESPEEASDGGYAVSNYKVIDKRLGTIDDLKIFQQSLQEKGMYLMIDMVLNHTSNQHEWAQKARQGNAYYQDFYYTYDDRTIPDQMETSMQEVFPESSPGSFSYDDEMNKWVMSVFHNYQWDLNFTNPQVLKAMLSNIFFYANLGIDILRIDAPAFIWKQMGTSCQNLPEAHTILQFIKVALEIAAPGMAILGEAIVAPKQIMDYFGKGYFTNHECDIAYNATQMALQWDALATTDTRNMIANQHVILQKPLGTTWVNYTRCHDDIGLGFEDYYIEQVGYNPYLHREYLKNYLGGRLVTSPSSGDLFGVNPKTNDARISGTLASLCGLEKAMQKHDEQAIQTSIEKILLMQANSIFLGGIPMIFYGDEFGYTNDYSYLKDPGKSYDNRWMHRPIIDWKKNAKIKQKDTIEHKVFNGLQTLLSIRKRYEIFSDYNNLEWLESHNRAIVGFKRTLNDTCVFCLFNYSPEPQTLTHYVFNSVRNKVKKFTNLMDNASIKIGNDQEHLLFKPYQYFVLFAEFKNH